MKGFLLDIMIYLCSKVNKPQHDSNEQVNISKLVKIFSLSDTFSCFSACQKVARYLQVQKVQKVQQALLKIDSML